MLEKLLPKGRIFNPLAPKMKAFVHALSQEFTRLSKLVSEVWKIDDNVEAWKIILNTAKARQRLTAQGGQSKEYLETVAQSFSKDAHVKRSGPCQIDVYGASVKRTVLRCTGNTGSKLRSYTRNEEMIKTFEIIKHAHIEAKYY